MSDNTPTSEITADALYDAATAQYAFHTLECLRREYNLASPSEQENIDCLIERGAQIVFNSDLPEAYVTVDQWTQINPHKWGIDDWADAIREIFIEDDHVSTRGFAGACHFNGPIAYQTFYPLNPTDEQLAEAREKAERYTAKAAALLASASTNATPETDASGGDTRDAQVYNMCRHIQAGNKYDYIVDDNLYSIYNQAARKHIIYVDGKKVASICRYQFSGDVSIRSRVWAINERVTELDAIHRYFNEYREEELNKLRETCAYLGSGSAISVYHL
jgi:hypothetical protein